MKSKVSEKSQNLIHGLRGKIFEAIVPTYLLDEAYHFLDWNRCFDEILAKPLKLERGMHAAEFVSLWANQKEALERSAKVFAVGKTPKVDHEPVVFKSRTYGQIEFQKLAVALHFEKTDEIGWVVSLNIRNADKLDLLFSDLLKFSEEMVYRS
jgi:hypothetical protein